MSGLHDGQRPTEKPSLGVTINVCMAKLVFPQWSAFFTVSMRHFLTCNEN